MPSIAYNEGALALQRGDVRWLADAIDVIPVQSTYTPDQDDSASVIAAAELAGITGYTGGFGGASRNTLTSKTLTKDTATNRVLYGAADPPPLLTLGVGNTIGGLLVVARGTSDDTDAVLLFFVSVPATATNGSDIVFAFPSGVIGGTQQ